VRATRPRPPPATTPRKAELSGHDPHAPAEDWHALTVEVPAGAVSGVSRALFGLGAAGVQEGFRPGEQPEPRQPWDTGAPPPLPRIRLLTAWFDHPDTASIQADLPAEASEPRWERVLMQDWEEGWKQGFEPITIAPDLVVAPPWQAPPGALLIEPGQGFGTGQHESTRGALSLMEPVLPGLQTCLDVGCGSGVLALLAARHGLRVHGIDIEESAVRNAHANAALNGLDGTFDTTPVHQITGRWDLVAGNLHAELLVRLAPDLLRLTGTWFVAAGILADREHLVREVFDRELVLDDRLTDGAWVALRYRRDRPAEPAP